jgi:sialate O-acetylesterase
MTPRATLLVLASVLLRAAAFGDVTPAPLFRDGAVLQRGKPVPVWGAAEPGERVLVSFAGQTVGATAGRDGRWSVKLTPLEASSTSRELTIKGHNTVVVRDVLVGEVWLASGQSNMEWALTGALEPKTEIAAANFPLIREFKVERAVAGAPAATVDGAWSVCSPDTAGKFSAVGYYFATSLHAALQVPIGIVNSSWGGTGIGPWIAAEGYRASPELAPYFAKQEKGKRATPEEEAAHRAAKAEWDAARAAAKKAGTPFTDPEPKAPAGMASNRTQTALYNAMIHPLVPYALRGAIWYQGESNVRDAGQYAHWFPALIGGWRQVFAQGDFPFYWVQLPNFDLGGQNATNFQWAELRAAQTKTLSVPNTGQAVTIDVGDPKNLHPKNKKPVGQRLALLALARTYGRKDVVDSGPVFASAAREGETWTVTFAKNSGPLVAAAAGLTGFELAGIDHVFHPAEARIEGDTVVVTSAAVRSPLAVRYAWRNAPDAGLFNAAGLPAAPFRSDDW